MVPSLLLHIFRLFIPSITGTKTSPKFFPPVFLQLHVFFHIFVRPHCVPSFSIPSVPTKARRATQSKQDRHDDESCFDSSFWNCSRGWACRCPVLFSYIVVVGHFRLGGTVGVGQHSGEEEAQAQAQGCTTHFHNNNCDPNKLY